MSSPPTVVQELPPLRDDRLYTADETSPYVSMSPNWLKRAAGADRIQHTRLGRSVRWSAKNIRDIAAGVPHEPTHGSTRSARAGGRTRQSKTARLSAA